MDNFNFRVANAAPRASGFEIGQNVGDTKTTYIYSYKTKYINGKSTGQKTNVDWDMESSIPSWVSVKYVFEGNDCKVTFTTLQENIGSSARTHTLVFKQRESGQTISFPISQEPNFTYTYYLNILGSSYTLESNIGDTVNVAVQSYKRRSDGELIAYSPSVGATPTFANKVTVQDYPQMGNHWYKLVVEATSANIGSTQRQGTLLVTCGDQRKETIIYQNPAEQNITLTINWPMGTDTVALFKANNKPITGASSTAYFSMSVSDDRTVMNYTKSTGIRVNLSNGGTEYALPGEWVWPFRWINGGWSPVNQFILPSSDTSITL